MMHWYGKLLLLWAASPLVLGVFIVIALVFESLKRKKENEE